MASVVAYTGLGPQILNIQENDSASENDWYAGDLVKADGSGELTIATDDAIMGIALKAATGVDNTEIPVQLLNFNEIYVMKYSTTTSEAIIGTYADITFTAGAHVVTDGTAVENVYIVGLHPDDAVGTDGGRVLVRFDTTALQTGV